MPIFSIISNKAWLGLGRMFGFTIAFANTSKFNKLLLYYWNCWSRVPIVVSELILGKTDSFCLQKITLDEHSKFNPSFFVNSMAEHNLNDKILSQFFCFLTRWRIRFLQSTDTENLTNNEIKETGWDTNEMAWFPLIIGLEWVNVTSPTQCEILSILKE